MAKASKKPVTREWLVEHYVNLGLTANDIAKIVKRNPKRVWEWLVNEGIETRPRGSYWDEYPNFAFWIYGTANPFKGKTHTEETKKLFRDRAIADGRVPFDPKVGPPFKGKRGAEVPSWKGGVTPLRQAFYSSLEWKAVIKQIWKRDDATCQRCGCRSEKGNRHKFDIHHIVSFACEELRADVSNLVLLCETCHYWVHSKENVNSEFIKPVPGFCERE